MGNHPFQGTELLLALCTTRKGSDEFVALLLRYVAESKMILFPPRACRSINP